MSSNRQRGEKIMLIGTNEFLNYRPFATESQPIRPSHLLLVAKEEILREQPRIMSGLLPYEESMEAVEYILDCETIDHGMIFMFHCFNILAEGGELEI